MGTAFSVFFVKTFWEPFPNFGNRSQFFGNRSQKIFWESHSLTPHRWTRHNFEHKYLLHQLRNCYTRSDDISKLRKFLSENDHLRLIKIDKSKYIAFIKAEDYNSKLSDEFPRKKFIVCESDPTSKDVAEFNSMLKMLKPEISSATFKQIKCHHKIKSSFGLLKVHKPEPHPLRPIIGSPGSLTSGIENWIYSIISKIIPNLKYSCASTKEFKDAFTKISSKITNEHCIWSADIVSMYPNINITNAIDVIIETVYKDPTIYFEPEDLDDGSINFYVQKNIFKSVLTSVLSKFTSFSTQQGFYKQRSGCSMGSKLAPVVANIYISHLETKLLDTEIRKKNILFVRRYVDDYCIISLSSAKNRIFNCLNKFDPSIKMTYEDMQNNQLAYLDTSIRFHKNSYQLFFYEKPGKSDILQNFKTGVAPFNQKLSTLTGEIYRRFNCTSCPESLNLALEQLTSRFLKNSYPLTLIKRKIKEIKDNNFEPLKRDESEVVKKFNLSLDFTSERCYKIGLSLQKLFRKVSPSFRVTVTWKTIRLERALGKFLKKVPNKHELNNIIYSWKCPCNAQYIGQTFRRAGIRWCEHVNSNNQNKASPSSIFTHMNSCETLQQSYLDYLSDPSTKPFLYTHRSKIAQSTYSLEFFHSNKPPEIRRKLTKNDYALKFFDVLQTNLTYESQRKSVEQFLILLHKPNLNEQSDFKSFKTF